MNIIPALCCVLLLMSPTFGDQPPNNGDRGDGAITPDGLDAGRRQVWDQLREEHVEKIQNELADPAFIEAVQSEIAKLMPTPQTRELHNYIVSDAEQRTATSASRLLVYVVRDDQPQIPSFPKFVDIRVDGRVIGVMMFPEPTRINNSKEIMIQVWERVVTDDADNPSSQETKLTIIKCHRKAPEEPWQYEVAPVSTEKAGGSVTVDRNASVSKPGESEATK